MGTKICQSCGMPMKTAEEFGTNKDVSKMLGHTNVKTTQIYAKVVDEKKEKAERGIMLNINK